MKNFEVSWVDMVVFLALLAGIVRGRKRGMSQELLDVFKWLIIVVVAGTFYAPLGNVLSANSIFSLLTCNLVAYTLVALGISLVFRIVRRAVGQKLVGSDVFGSGEYYLGMFGGFLRYVCVVIVMLSFFNARRYTPEEVRRAAQYQQENFGSIAFPTLSSLQEEIIRRSWTGKLATEYLASVLMRATTPEEKGLVQEGNIVRAREREVERVLAK